MAQGMQPNIAAQGVLVAQGLQHVNAAQGVPAYSAVQASSLAHQSSAAGSSQCGPFTDVPKTLGMSVSAVANAVVAPVISALGIPVPPPQPQIRVIPAVPALNSAAVTALGPLLAVPQMLSVKWPVPRGLPTPASPPRAP